MVSMPIEAGSGTIAGTDSVPESEIEFPVAVLLLVKLKMNEAVFVVAAPNMVPETNVPSTLNDRAVLGLPDVFSVTEVPVNVPKA